MPKNHMKRVAAPRTWPIKRKTRTFVMRPDAGKKLALSMPLGLILREVIGATENSRQTKAIINAGSVLVDGKARKELRFPVGLYEVIEIVPDKKQYRVVLNDIGLLTLVAIPAAEKTVRIQKIVSKNIVKGNKLQLGLLSGVVVQMDANAKSVATYTVGDSVQIDEKNAVAKHLPLNAGSSIQFIGGKHIGGVGKVEALDGNKVTAVINGEKVETLSDYAVVIGDDKKSFITLAAKSE